MLAGTLMDTVAEDDHQYLVDLGLLRRDGAGGLVVANPIYREVLPRALASDLQDTLPRMAPTWLNADGNLNPERLPDAFLTFWRQHGQPLFDSALYHEIAPHLVLMALLHRVVNGGGTLEREYAIGSGCSVDVAQPSSSAAPTAPRSARPVQGDEAHGGVRGFARYGINAMLLIIILNMR